VGPHRVARVVAEAVVAGAGVALLAWAWIADRRWFETHVGDAFCTVDPAQLRTRTVWRVLAVVAGALLISFVRPFAGRWASRRTGRGAAVDLARYLLPALLAVFVADLYLRATRKPEWELLPPIVDDARYGWAYPKGTSKTIRTGDRDIVYAVDSLGDRAASPDAIPDLDRPTILLLGESFANGIGVQREETIAALLERRLGVQVLDTSVWAWDHNQEYVRMQDLLPRLAHPLAVVVVSIGQQLDRDGREARRWRPRFTVEDGALREVPTSAPGWWIDSPLRQRAHDVVSLHGPGAVPLARALFAAIARAARARGAYPLVLMTNWGPPCLAEAGGESSLEALLFDGSDVPHVRTDLAPGTEDGITHHPTPAGQVLLATAIEDALVGAGVATRRE
jgi:hypothetical protein